MFLTPCLVSYVDAQQIPELVHLHPLPGEGHLSAFCYNDKIHRETLTTLFGVSGGSRAPEHVGSNPEELEKIYDHQMLSW